MVIKVKIPNPLQRFTKGMAEIDENYEGTIIGLIGYLDKQYPGIGERISENGKVRRFVNFYVNEQDIRFQDVEKTPVMDGDEVSIVPAIAGGRNLDEVIKYHKS